MKTLLYGFLLAGLFLNLSSSYRGDFYQVISSHPHDLKELSPYIKTVHQDGRLWVVQLSDDTPEEVREHVRLMNGNERSYLYQSVFSNMIKLKSDNEIERLVKSVNIKNIQQDVVKLSSYESRYVGSQGNKEALKYTSDRLSKLGYEVEEVCYSSSACSLVAERVGTYEPEKVIMVMAHIDSVGKAFAGADDNASGTAVALEMANVLRSYNNRKTLRFFITNGEELGLLGAKHYAQKLEREGSISELDLVINMDMVGYNKSNNIVELETNPEYDSLAQWFAELAQRYTKLKTKITLGAWGSDHVPFLDKGVPSILTIENWSTKTPCYHMACDTPDTINYQYAAEIGRLNVSAVISKDRN